MNKRINLKWQKERPDYACVFLTKQHEEYDIWMFSWELLETDDNLGTEWGLAWLNQYGDLWDEIEECDFDEYLVLEILLTKDECHKKWLEEHNFYGD